MSKLKFVQDDDGNDTKEASGMYSKEGEFVEFDSMCDCSGQVRRSPGNSLCWYRDGVGGRGCPHTVSLDGVFPAQFDSTSGRSSGLSLGRRSPVQRRWKDIALAVKCRSSWELNCGVLALWLTRWCRLVPGLAWPAFVANLNSILGTCLKLASLYEQRVALVSVVWKFLVLRASASDDQDEKLKITAAQNVQFTALATKILPVDTRAVSVTRLRKTLFGLGHPYRPHSLSPFLSPIPSRTKRWQEAFGKTWRLFTQPTVVGLCLQVEVWLNRVMESMRSTVKHELSEAVVAYEEKPRDQWLFDYPAQVALCGTQIWWTTEVGIAFGRLEEGYENALKDYYKKQVSLPPIPRAGRSNTGCTSDILRLNFWPHEFKRKQTNALQWSPPFGRESVRHLQKWSGRKVSAWAQSDFEQSVPGCRPHRRWGKAFVQLEGWIQRHIFVISSRWLMSTARAILWTAQRALSFRLSWLSLFSSSLPQSNTAPMQLQALPRTLVKFWFIQTFVICASASVAHYQYRHRHHHHHHRHCHHHGICHCYLHSHRYFAILPSLSLSRWTSWPH